MMRICMHDGREQPNVRSQFEYCTIGPVSYWFHRGYCVHMLAIGELLN